MRDILTPWDCIKDGKQHTFVFPYSSLHQAITTHAKKNPNHPALIAPAESISWSFSDLAGYVHRTGAYFLQTLGLQAGTSVAFLMENTSEALLINWAAWSYGYVSVPLDSKRDALERKVYKLKLAGAQVLFVRTGLLEEAERAALSQELPQMRIIDIENTQQFLSLLPNVPRDQSIPYTGKHDQDCLLLFTSGTTALPKAVRLTPHSLLSDADQICQWLQITRDERFLISLPLHHINSTTFSLATLIAGGTVVVSQRYSKSEFWRTMAEQQITLTSIVPTIALDLLSEQNAFEQWKERLTQLTRIQIGSAPVQANVVLEFYKRFGIRLVQGYGSTETSLRCLGVPSSVNKDQYLELVDCNTVGVELAHNNVTVLLDDGSEAAEGQEGEVCVRGPNIMRGYKDNQAATSDAFQYNWFHTGDMGFFQYKNGQKFYFLKGRVKELIIKGGINISPLAVEDAISRAFPDLFFCYAIGFPDQRLGEQIGIVVDGPTDVLAAVQTAIKKGEIGNLARYESPAAMVRVPHENLPKTSSGKIQRIEMRQQFNDVLRKESRTIAVTTQHRFRLVESTETDMISDLVDIHNSRWPKPLHITPEVLRRQTQYGIVIGMFEHAGLCVGFISALGFFEHALLNREPWTQTWNGITGGGTLSTHAHKGDSVMCVGITVKKQVANKGEKQNTSRPSDMLTEERLSQYLASDTDSVITFHKIPKAGFDTGAEITQAIANGRPDDTEALGYNVLLRYPVLSHAPVINEQASPGVQLIEAALLYAYSQGKRNVYVYSRPALLSRYFRRGESEIMMIDRSLYDDANIDRSIYKAKPGVNREVILEISKQKNEPQWMLDKRLKAYEFFQKTIVPTWGPDLSRLNLDDIVYFIRPDAQESRSWDDVPDDIKKTFDRLGIPEAEKQALAGVGAQYDSDVVYHNIREDLKKKGVIFENMDTAVREYPDLVKKYFMTQCVPINDHKFVMLHAAVWSGGTFIYVPKGVKVDLPLQAYFRMNAESGGQFEHTLIIADEGSELEYIEGCSAPRYTTNSLHAGCVEIFVHKNAKVKYFSIENWSKNTYNLNTKRALVDENGHVEWVSGNMGSGVTMLYPCSVLRGRGATSDSLGIAFAGPGQHQDTGAKAIHAAPNTSSIIRSRSISVGGGIAGFRGLIRVTKKAIQSTASMSCDSLLLDESSIANTYPALKIDTNDVSVAHEARIGKIGDEELFYLMSRGLSAEQAMQLIVSGFVEPIVKALPLEYALELNKLIELEMEGAVG